MKNLLLHFRSIRFTLFLSVWWFGTFSLCQVFAQNADKAMNFERTKKVQQLSGSNANTATMNKALPNSSKYFRAPASDWQYMKSITLSSATNQDNYQIKVELTTSNFNYSHANSDGSDLRFHDGNGTELSYWIENWDASGTSTIWVKIPTAGTTEIFMYYGNPSASKVSSGIATFDFFDDFEDGDYDGWASRSYETDDVLQMETDHPLEGAYSLKLHQGNSWGYVEVWSPFISNPDILLKVKAKQTGFENMYNGSGMGFVVLYYNDAGTLLKALVWPVYTTTNPQTHPDWIDKAPNSERVDDWNLADSQVGERELNVSEYKPVGATKIKIKAIIQNVNVGDFWVDLFRVRKYSTSEPVVTVGDETDIRIKYVATNGSNTPPYDTWGKAATSIQVAIDAANPGDTIIVGSSGTGHGDGVYTENVNVTKSLTIKSESGYATTTVIATNANDHVFEVTANNVTIGGEGCGFSIYGATGSGYFTYYAGIYLSGTTNCTIHDNRCGWDSEHYNTEGIYLSSSSNNTITGNATSSNNDCGIFLYYFSSNNTITNNSALNNNYGIYLHASGNNTVMGNTADNNKLEGIHLYDSNANTFTGNTASSNAHYGIYLYSSSNNTFYLNNLYNNPSGNAYVYGGSSVNNWNSPTPIYYDYTGGSFHKNILGNYYGDYTGSDADRDGIGADSYNGLGMTDNYPLMTTSEHYSLQAWWLNNDGKMYRDDRTKAYGNVTLNAGNSQIWIASEVATKNISYSGNDTWTGQIVFTTTPANGDEFTVEIGSSTDGNDFISGGPQAIITGDGYKTIFTFETNAAAFNLTNGNYLALRLTNNSSAYNYEVQTGGAWSYCSSAEIVTEPPTGKNEIILPDHFSLYQNQPNPFVTSTMIRYELPERSNVSLKVYDLFGREVTTLFEGEQNAGKYEVEFNGTNLPGGIYFYKMSTKGFSETKKLILLK